MAEITWIKLKTTMFDDEKIRLIQSLPEADAILVIWIRLLVLAGKTNDDGLIYIQRNMPYTEEMLATLFNKPVSVVKLALITLRNFEMVDLGEDGLIAISNWEKHQNIEGMDKIREQNRLRKAKQRDKQKLLNEVTGLSRDGHATDKELDKEIEIDKDINNKESGKSSCKYSDEHLRLAEKLKNNLINDFPKEMGKVKIDKWANSIRLMTERDNLTIEQIEFVLDWLPTNTFWSTNIRSVNKLREQFERLKVEIKKEREVKPRTYGKQSIRKETLPDWAKDENQITESTPLSEEEQAEFQAMLKSLEKTHD